MTPKRIRGSLRERFMNYCGEVDQMTGCMPWLASTRAADGYGQIMNDELPRRPLLAHRVAWTLFKGKLNPSLEILHKCNNPRCVNPEHLEQGTHQQNIQEAARDGLMRGPRKFTKEDYDYVKNQVATGMKKGDVARNVGCSPSLITKILNGSLKNADAR